MTKREELKHEVRTMGEARIFSTTGVKGAVSLTSMHTGTGKPMVEVVVHRFTDNIKGDIAECNYSPTGICEPQFLDKDEVRLSLIVLLNISDSQELPHFLGIYAVLDQTYRKVFNG